MITWKWYTHICDHSEIVLVGNCFNWNLCVLNYRWEKHFSNNSPGRKVWIHRAWHIRLPSVVVTTYVETRSPAYSHDRLYQPSPGCIWEWGVPPPTLSSYQYKQSSRYPPPPTSQVNGWWFLHLIQHQKLHLSHQPHHEDGRGLCLWFKNSISIDGGILANWYTRSTVFPVLYLRPFTLFNIIYIQGNSYIE